MFKQSERLPRAVFDTYFKSGKRHQTPELTLIHHPYESTHAAVVVGKKVARKAHDRNKLRRRVYGILYRTLKKTNQPGVFILLTKPAFALLTKKQQLESVQKLLTRITISE